MMHDPARRMDFTENAEWLAREIKATPMVLAARPLCAEAAVHAWIKLEAMVLNRAMQRHWRETMR